MTTSNRGRRCGVDWSSDVVGSPSCPWRSHFLAVEIAADLFLRYGNSLKLLLLLTGARHVRKPAIALPTAVSSWPQVYNFLYKSPHHSTLTISLQNGYNPSPDRCILYGPIHRLRQMCSPYHCCALQDAVFSCRRLSFSRLDSSYSILF